MFRLPRLSILTLLVAVAPALHAEIIVEGDYSPAEPFWSNGGNNATDVIIGNTGNATLLINEGSSLVTRIPVIGKEFSSTATVTLTGPGTTWSLAAPVTIGDYGNGSVSIQNGAAFFTSAATIASNTVGIGSVTVTGQGSQWGVNGLLTVGSLGTGSLTVADGATVTATQGSFIVSSNSVINLQVSGNGMLAATLRRGSQGAIRNDGVVNLYADAALAPGVYTPISAPGGFTYVTTQGAYNAYGGSWDNTAHTFTVSSVIETQGVIDMDLSNLRLGFDSDQLVAAFATDAGVASFDAAPISLSLIQGNEVLAAYAFTTDLSDGITTMLSYYLGEGILSDAFTFWHRADGATDWTAYQPGYQTYTDGWVNFTVTGFSSYAVTMSAIPEPSVYLFLCLAGGLFFILHRRRIPSIA